MIGAGYVGLVSGACLSEFGFEVTCVDSDEAKIAKLNNLEIPIYEPGLEELIARNHAAKRLTFSSDFESAVNQSEIIFVAVGTPSRRGDGKADLTYVFQAAKRIAHCMSPGAIIVIKSTVVIGTCQEVKKVIKTERPDVEFSIVSNPEFLREGSAIEDFMRPDRVIVGAEDDRSREALARIYDPLSLRETPIVMTSLENAELIKFAANSYLAMKVTFINEIANLCEKTNCDVQKVASAIGLDKRINANFLNAGPGFGGSCFPKDTTAFADTARELGTRLELVETTIQVNKSRKREMAQRILAVIGSSPSKKTVGILGIAFKPNTDDIRDAPSLEIIPQLINAGVSVKVHDPVVQQSQDAVFSNVEWVNDPYEASENVDVVVVLTEWTIYRGLDLVKMAKLMKGRELVDLRNIYRTEDVLTAGLNYTSIGKPPSQSKDNTNLD